MHLVGPHVLTPNPTDAARTFSNLGELWRVDVHELDPGRIATDDPVTIRP